MDSKQGKGFAGFDRAFSVGWSAINTQFPTNIQLIYIFFTGQLLQISANIWKSDSLASL